MKNIIYAALLVVIGLTSLSCKKDPKLPTPSVEEFPLIFTNTSTQSTYKLSDVQGTGNPTATFTIDVKGGDLDKVESIEVYRTFRGFNVPSGTAMPTLAFGGPTVLLRTVPPASGSIEVTLTDIIANLTRATGPSQGGNRTAITRASLKANEGFLFTYALLLKGGRRIEFNQSFNAAPLSGLVTIVP